MFIESILLDKVDLRPPMTDIEFISHVINYCSEIFIGEMIAIKNSQLEYIAMSGEYATEFGLSPSSIGQKIVYTSISEEVQTTILQQEQDILEKYQFQDSVFFYQKNGKTEFSGLRKRQLVNPFTHNIVGILIVASKFKPGLLRKHYLKLFVPAKKYHISDNKYQLTSNEQSIIFALLLGFHSRKEIAGMLSNITREKINENRVKNGLNALYQKFQCSNISQLLTLISNDQINLDFPPDVYATGNYPLE